MVYRSRGVMGTAKAKCITAGALKKSAADGIAVEPAGVPPDERLTGIAWPVTLSARRCRAAGLLFVGDRYDGTDHQAFDPNRDNRHFKRGSICGLLGRLGASRVLGRLRGPIQRVTLPVVTSWAGAGGQCGQIINCFFSFDSSARSAASLLRPRFFGVRLAEAQCSLSQRW
jgi:hypothetical protein